MRAINWQKLPQERLVVKLAMAIGLMICCLVIYYWFVGSKLHEQLQITKIQTVQLQNKFEQEVKAADLLKVYVKQADKLQKQSEPNIYKRPSQILNTINDIAIKDNLRIESIKPQGMETLNNYNVLFYNFKLKSNYFAINKFLYDVFKRESGVYVQGFELRANADNGLLVNFNLRLLNMRK